MKAKPVHYPRAQEAIGLLLRQGDLQPFLSASSARSLGSTCADYYHAHPHAALAGAREQKFAALLVKQLFDEGDTWQAMMARTTSAEALPPTGHVEDLMVDCRDLLWQADAHRRQRHVHLPPREIAARRRCECLAYIYAVKYGGSYEAGLRVVQKLRKTDLVALATMMMMDATTLGTSMVALGAVGSATYATTGWCVRAAASAWREGGFWNGVKAVGLGAGGGLFAGAGAAAASLVVHMTAENMESSRQARTIGYAGEKTNDLMLATIMGGRHRKDPISETRAYEYFY